MNVYILQLIFIILTLSCGTLIAASNPMGSSTVFISNSQSYEARRMRSRSASPTIFNLVLVAIALGCMFGLYITNFQPCSFMMYWLPQSSPILVKMFCN